MSLRVRRMVLLPALAVLGGVLLAGFAGLPDFGHYRGPYGNVLARVAVPERGATNVVAATVFDYRGFDTLGEEFILFCAVTGTLALLRDQAEEPRPGEDEEHDETLRVTLMLVVGPCLVIAAWLAAFGYVTPGGGFQAGVLFAGVALLVYLGVGQHAFARAGRDDLVDPLEGLGAGGYVVIGLAALIAGMPFLHNLLGRGVPGTLRSGGSIGFLSWASAIEVAAANILLFSHFLKAHVVPLFRDEEET
jgi:multicomponent Na+:H+ antiporter subunit B